MKVKKLNENFEELQHLAEVDEGVNMDKLRATYPELDEAVKAYRKFANLADDEEITESLDEWALNEAAAIRGVQKMDLRKRLLGEDVTLDQAARELDAEKERIKSDGQIVRALNASLDQAEEMQEEGDTSDFPNILLISEPGFGKTEIVDQWAKANNINLFYYNLGTAQGEDFGGIVARDLDNPAHATRLTTELLVKALSRPRSVLFLDEYNRSKDGIRGNVLTLIQNHRFMDPTEEKGYKFLPNFLFTVAAINPPKLADRGASDMNFAEMSRFRKIEVAPDASAHLRYLRGYYTDKINNAKTEDRKLKHQGRLALAEKILTNPQFSYDTALDMEEHDGDIAYNPINYRSFKRALDASDGTKKGLLNVWNEFCNYDKKHTIEGILEDYVDVNDKANDALKHDTASDVFAPKKSNMKTLRQKYNELNT